MVIGAGPTCGETNRLTVDSTYVTFSGALRNADNSARFQAYDLGGYYWFFDTSNANGFFANMVAPTYDWRLMRRVSSTDFTSVYVERSTGNVGIGVSSTLAQTPPALFNVGTSSQFRVDSSGNLIRVNDVAYSWPVAQGAASTVLSNDGSGNLSWSPSSGGGGAVFAGSLMVYVDGTNGTDAPGGGTLGAPYRSINYAYSQVASLGAPANTVYTPGVEQFVTQKLIFRIAPGRYVGDVTLGFKRARVQLIGDGVQIVGNVKMSVVRADFPADSLESLKASFPAPWTGQSAQMTFEITGEAGGGVEADASAVPLVVTGLTSLAFEEPAFAGYGLGANWENNFGQFYYYANKANLIGGMVVGTSYTIPTTRGLATSVIEVDSCTIGNAGLTRTYFGAVPYAYISAPATWNKGTGVATGTQSATTLQDNTKTWTVNEYAGSTVRLTSGTGSGGSATVVSNTANTLTISSPWGTTPVSGSTTYSLIGINNKVPEGTLTLKAHNNTIASAMGPLITAGEVDGCRLYDIDRTMLGTVDNGSVLGSTSSSLIGFVVDQFRVFSGTGVPPSQYQLGNAASATRYKMDSTSYTTLAFSRSGAGVLTSRTLNLGAGVSFDLLDDSRSLGYSANAANWVAPAPTTVAAALDRMATLLKTLNGGASIP